MSELGAPFGWRPPANSGAHSVELRPVPGGEVAIYRSPAPSPRPRRILALKLDHFGDFIIGLPALRRLREVFADDHLTLVVSSWNAATARASGLADELRICDFFPENGALWTGSADLGIERFRQVSAGRFDLAIDLRVDEDTRPLLAHADAGLRCGIGSRARHPFLDIVLPAQPRSVEARPFSIEPARFLSRMPVQKPFFHETDFSVTDTHLVYGPYIRLPEGRLRAFYGLELRGLLRRCPGFAVTLDIVRGEPPELVAEQRLRRVADINRPVEIVFDNPSRDLAYEFRLHARGRVPGGRLRFFGIRVEPLERPEEARQIPAELHVGEQLSLLVSLVETRMHRLYAGAPLAAAAAPAALLAGTAGRRIVLAPFSNSQTRDWGLDRYARLIGLLRERADCAILLVGAPAQRAALDQLVAQHPGEPRVVNLAGQSDWPGTAALLAGADLVIGNNSGVVHLAAASGVPTLAIYSGSHQPQEWGPRGTRVEALMALVPCSPCGHEKLALCPHEHRCMQRIAPELVAERALSMLRPSG